MTFDRFRQIWDDVFSRRQQPTNPSLVDHGTPHTNEELIKVSEGKPSAFDEIDRRLAEHDAQWSGNWRGADL